MKRLAFCLGTLLLLCSGCTTEQNQADGIPIGTWDAISLDSGKGPESAAGIQLIITKERITQRRPNGDTTLWGEIARFDPLKNPGEIDIRVDTGTWLGIYELKGDRLMLVARDPGEPRPKEFVGSRKGLLFKLKRAK